MLIFIELKIFLLIAFVLSGVVSKHASSDDRIHVEQQEEQEIEDFVLELLECLSIPGLSLAAVRNGEVVVSKGYGKADVDLDIDVTSQTRFNIASTTKAFTAVLLAQLLSENELYSWESPVRDIIGDWFYFSDGYRSNGTTLRDVLGHKMGIAGHDYLWLMDQWSNKELVERVRFLEPVRPYRTDLLYNNIMYAVAGYAAQELAGGATYEDLITNRIFEPLGMDLSTFTYLSAPDFEGFAIPYTGPRGEDRFPAPWELFRGDRSIAAAGAIVSTADDMSRWLNFMLGQTGPVDPPLEVEVAWETFRAETVTLFPEFSRPEYQETLNLYGVYCRGWFDGHYRGYKVISHDGAMDGYYTLVSLMPDMGIGVYSSMNYNDLYKEKEWLHAYIMDVLVGDGTWFNATDVCSWNPGPGHEEQHNQTPQPRREVDHKPIRPLEEYTGEYGNFAYGNVSIYLEGELLQLQYGNNGYYDLVPTGLDDVFDTVGNRSPADYLEMGRVFFSSSPGSGAIDLMSLPYFTPLDPPLFIRDLQLDDAPPPSLEGCAP